MVKESPLSSSSSTPSRHRWTYDVFLSFRGEDTRKKFVRDLDASLRRQGIEAFKDDRELERGKTISKELLQAIEESEFSIVVLSPNYASSKWCLQELAHIVWCSESLHQIVLPVFYCVNRRDVRHQDGTFKTDFLDHDKNCPSDAQRWRSAMEKVSHLSGRHVTGDKSEAEAIEELVDKVSRQVRLDLLSEEENLVGMRWRKQQVYQLLSVRSADVRFIGIWGMRGIGKSALARAIYKSIAHEFHGSCFLQCTDQLSPGGLESLQRRLLCNILRKNLNDIGVWADDDEGATLIRSRLCDKKVLIVLDDVAEPLQLKKLADRLDWFGPGSRIIITTTKEHVLEQHGVDRRYGVEFLNHSEGYRLFSLEAFGAGYSPRDFLKLSNRVVEYCGGLPRALEVLGSFLKNRPKEVWEGTLARLKEAYNKDSFDISLVMMDFIG